MLIWILLMKQILGGGNHKHQELVYARVNNNGISYNSTHPSNYRIWGYIKDYNDLTDGTKYWQMWPLMEDVSFNMLTSMTSDIMNRQYYVPYDKLTVRQYPITPKAYMIKVDQIDMNAKQTELTINGKKYYMDVGNPNKSGQSEPYRHTGYIFVLADEDNPYRLDVQLNQNELTQGERGKSQAEIEQLMSERVNQGNIRLTVKSVYYERTKKRATDMFLERSAGMLPRYQFRFGSKRLNNEGKHTLSSTDVEWVLRADTGEYFYIESIYGQRLYANSITNTWELVDKESDKYSDPAHRDNFLWQFGSRSTNSNSIINKANNKYLAIDSNNDELVMRDDIFHWRLRPTSNILTMATIKSTQPTDSYYGPHYSNPQNLLDGNQRTHWNGLNRPVTLTIEWPEKILLQQFVMRGNLYGPLKISVSNDGMTWETIHTSHLQHFINVKLEKPKFIKYLKIDFGKYYKIGHWRNTIYDIHMEYHE